MDFFEVIEKRYSYRGEFEDAAIPKQDIVKILDAGLRAPSGLNYQPVEFVAVTDPGLRAKLHEILPGKHTATAPLIVVVVTTRVTSPKGACFEVEDYGAAVENVLLALTALGYASVWIDGETKAQGRGEAIAKLLGVPEGWTVRCVLPVGVAKAPGAQRERKAFEERVHFEQWGS